MTAAPGIARGMAAAGEPRILVIAPHIRTTLAELLHGEVGRLRCKARDSRTTSRRRSLEGRADELAALAAELAR